jgi:hypothetical protein
MLTAQNNNFSEGFTMTFANGYTISVQFWIGNYCSRNDNNKAASAEIAIWDKDNTWYNFGDDLVKGHCSPDEIVTWMRKVKDCEYTGDKWVLYNSETEQSWCNSEGKMYVYDNKDEAMEDYWGDTCVPTMVKDLPNNEEQRKALTQELNKIIL